MSRKSDPPPGKQSADPVLLQTEELESVTMRKIAWRLVPFLCLIYVVAFIDRINIGFAALTMSKDLGLTPAMFGLGAGIFFIGYFLFEVPSNLILHRVGLLLAGLFHDYHVLVVLLLSIAIAGVMAARPPFWATPSDFLTGQKAAAGIAAINSIGNLGGFLGPFLIGWARQATGSFTMGLMISAVTLLASAMFVISLRGSAKLSILQLQPATQH